MLVVTRFDIVLSVNESMDVTRIGELCEKRAIRHVLTKLSFSILLPRKIKRFWKSQNVKAKGNQE